MITKLSTYKLFEILIDTEKQLNEGLILTHDIYNSIYLIGEFFKFDQLKSINPNGTKIELTVNHFDLDTFTKFLILINNLGYYIAIITMYNSKNMPKNIKLSEFKSEYYSDEFISKLTRIDFALEPKFDVTHKLKSDTLYHVTESRYVDRILETGLIAKSKNTKTEYPERIYFVYDLEDAKNYINGKNEYYLTSINKSKFADKSKYKHIEYKIIKITMNGSDNLTFYEDPNFKGKGLYTYDNISPEKITVDE